MRLIVLFFIILSFVKFVKRIVGYFLTKNVSGTQEYRSDKQPNSKKIIDAEYEDID